MKKFALASLLLIAAVAQAENVTVETGTYKTDWESLGAWECPEWFKDVKFGIWAHWGPQCEAEDGDWYARGMYYQGSSQYNWHLSHYGNPAEFGFKDVINEWEAEEWNPADLIKLYYEAGARYFFTLGQHHDNFDLWNSPYQPWNSVNMGPKKDIVKGWADACKEYDMRFGVSMHGAHAWTWYEIAQDYDGNLTAADGKGKWWEGYDPQDLYAQQHTTSTGYKDSGKIHSQWDWGNGASLPSDEYKMKFQNRVLQCINDYNPDMLYFDDTVLPFYGCDDAPGLNILSHYYNHDVNTNGDGVVVMGKQLLDIHKNAMLWDVERGVPDRVQERYWQTCTCIGQWHYNVNNTNYKSAQQVVCMLVDIISKNGNLLLSVPIRGNGTIDAKERAVVEGIAKWMKDNSESIYGTRVWKTCGEGPLVESANPLTAQGFNESNNYSSKDVRYVQKADKVYATIMAWPTLCSDFTFESFGYASPYFSGKVTSVKLLGSAEAISYNQDFGGLTVTIPNAKCNDIAPVFEITLDESATELSFADFVKYFEEQYDAIADKAAAFCTGKYNPDKIFPLADAINNAKEVLNGSEEDQKEALLGMQEAYSDVRKNGLNAGGIRDLDGIDVTVKYLKEDSKFTRTSDTNNGLRFGKPEYWTVENFNIKTSTGNKQGIDRFPGYNCLMLGVWDDRQNSQEGDVANARIYQTLELPAGCYYFGAQYQTLYQLNNAYMYVAETNVTTDEVPDNSIAYYKIGDCEANSNIYGLFFRLEEDSKVCIGFQADLNGVDQQEFRASKIELVHIGDPDFKCEDLTIEKLMDADNFRRFQATDDNTRFGKPLYWEVENFEIPNGTDGIKQGIDHYPGYNCLMLGVWDDAAQNQDGDLTNARIYRKITLDPGHYTFAAMFQTTYNLTNKAYMFVADELMTTDQLAEHPLTLRLNTIGENDGKWHAIAFDINETKEIILGFQANLTEKAQQEFRVKSVRLQRIQGEATDAIISVTNDEYDGEVQYYNLMGMRLNSAPSKGLYILKQGSKSRKIIAK